VHRRVAESTFLCEYYLGYRGVARRALTIPLDMISTEIRHRRIDVALNVHSFSECPLRAICWWLDLLVANRVRHLMDRAQHRHRIALTRSGRQHARL